MHLPLVPNRVSSLFGILISFPDRFCSTPIINSLSDVYGYLRFLRIRPWYDWKEFHGHVNLLEKKNRASTPPCLNRGTFEIKYP